MTDEETRLNKWKAELEAKTRKLAGRVISDQENEEMRKKLYGDSAFSKRYPGSNGCEMAILAASGAIQIIDSSTSGGTKSHGTQVYSPDDKDFDYYWKRHDFDNQKSATHVIMKRFDEETQEWIELGQEWI
jgi:hypothetical protein